MNEQLDALINSGRPWAAQRAAMAKQLIEQRQAGQLEADEYQELLGDLVATDKLDAVADDIQIKSMLINAIYIASQI